LWRFRDLAGVAPKYRGRSSPTNSSFFILGILVRIAGSNHIHLTVTIDAGEVNR
jgi:hypothetical protein